LPFSWALSVFKSSASLWQRERCWQAKDCPVASKVRWTIRRKAPPGIPGKTGSPTVKRDAVLDGFEKGFKLRDTAARQGQSLSVVLFDIDHFKHINDRYAHGVGDQAIPQTVLAFKDTLRAGELIGRLGGEAFILVLPGSDLSAALTRTDLHNRAVDSVVEIHEQRLLLCAESLASFRHSGGPLALRSMAGGGTRHERRGV
jgi:diguanylate cyclase (GGDEF)-like protein